MALLASLSGGFGFESHMFLKKKTEKKDVSESSVKLYDKIIERESQCKYPGIILTDNNMSNTMDSDRVLNKFLRQYNSMYHIYLRHNHLLFMELNYGIMKEIEHLIMSQLDIIKQ